MQRLPRFDELTQAAVFVDYSPGFKLGEFDCGIDDYNVWLQKDAEIYIRDGMSHVKLLISKQNADIIGYMALSADAFRLNEEEKQSENLDVDISTVPALKIGKLAIDKRYHRRYYGLFLLWLAFAIASDIAESNIGCRFLSVDADIEHNPETVKFYEKAGFIRNESYSGRTKAVSMRFDIQSDQ